MLRLSRLHHIHSQLLSINFYQTQPLPYSTDISFASNASFHYQSIPFVIFPLGLTLLTSDLVIFITKCVSSIPFTCPNHCNTPYITSLLQTQFSYVPPHSSLSAYGWLLTCSLDTTSPLHSISFLLLTYIPIFSPISHSRPEIWRVQQL